MQDGLINNKPGMPGLFTPDHYRMLYKQYLRGQD